MLIVHTSNRLESLGTALAAVIRSSPLPPLEAETVVTQSIGMSRWLALNLAEELGVTANIHFPFPAKFATAELSRLLPTVAAPAFLEREFLPWRIHAVLDELLPLPEFKMLGDYAEGDFRKQWDLCKQLAATFDRYIAHRPQMLREWDAGKSDPAHAWQARLWKSITRDSMHPAALLQRASRLTSSPPAPRCSIFGLSSLAPTYLEFLEILSAHREVHLFMLAPTRHYWGDVQSTREKARFLRWCERRSISADASTIEEGHALLASLGKVGRDFHDALIDIPGRDMPDAFVAQPDGTLLQRLQNDILELRPHAENRAIEADDYSIQLHNCHSPLRELEVLHDQLLSLFEADTSLTPRDVLVAVPDIDEYAPFIDSVFGNPESDATQFPYSIADRRLRGESGVADAFLRILEIADTRMPATAVLAIMEISAVSAKFGIEADEIDLIRQWIAESGIRWGRDAAHRAELGLPEVNEHTWAFGLDRLILGFALPGDGTILFNGILPSPAVEGSLAITLGKLANFLHTLFDVCTAMREPLTVSEWSRTLLATLTTMCESDYESAEQWREVAESINLLDARAVEAGHTKAVPFVIIRECITDAISANDRGSGFLRGGITFCSLKPMRAIPHRIVCLAGMNDGVFPRQDRAASFDITAAQPRPGDRSTRDNDRYLFLEALLSARDRLIISWCGQSPRDNSALPPSVIVVELIDVLKRSYEVSAESLITKHRLQPFSADYFSEGRLFSYSAANATGAASRGKSKAPTPFVTPVPTLDIPRDLTIDRLIYALTATSQFFAKERLGITLPYEDTDPGDQEPVDISGLERYSLHSRILEALLSNQNTESLQNAAAAAGELPHGYTGVGRFGDIHTDAAALAATANERLPGPLMAPVLVSIPIGERILSGNLGAAKASGLLRIRGAKLGGKDLIRAWVQHLALCAAPSSGIERRTVLLSTDTPVEFLDVSTGDAITLLQELLNLHDALHSRPLPLFPKASRAFAEYSLNLSGRLKESPSVKAATVWSGDAFSGGGEWQDPWNRLVWRDHENPLGEEFQNIAMLVFGPLLKHCNAK